MGRLAKFYGGGLPISHLEKMYWHEIENWDYNFLLQTTEEEVLQELQYDEKGNKKQLPNYKRIREIVLDRVKKKKEDEINGE